MKPIKAFFNLIRWPNLVFILLTQVIYEYCIFERIYPETLRHPHDQQRFWMLVIASVLIAAAGYIINDYFDRNIDFINKPNRVIVGTIIGRRWAIFLHGIMSLCGLTLTAIALPGAGFLHIVILNFFSIALLWYYSATLKRKLLIGNVAIGVLTGWTLLLIFLSKFSLTELFDPQRVQTDARFFRITIVYAGFSFIITLIREAVKDMEDMYGDMKEHCNTMPIAWGVKVTKVYTSVWLVVLIAAITIIVLYVVRFGWWWETAFSILLILFPLLRAAKDLLKAETTQEFHHLSTQIKIIMLTGILSMILYGF